MLEGHLVGAVLIGSIKGKKQLMELIKSRQPLGDQKNALLEV